MYGKKIRKNEKMNRFARGQSVIFCNVTLYSVT